ncbi:ferritin-like domain-containing protein [Mycetohabitans endofungorum]|uniref:ferritin-like domain-containing protein n=1 Tax=Mycetohabitans endofungorum TaxID=417203 RepID=UPI002B05A43D|nr:ferritin-like domain-containing protein [Mycetohabitans endofungorum]
MPNDNLKTENFKLFPRNLTARADALVRGNPVTSRSESGVENCFPGLEFDQRNIDKAFFPGLQFEMHHASGVILRDFGDASAAAPFIARNEIDQGVFLVYIEGVFASRMAGVAPSSRVVRFVPPAGLESWRYVRDLEIGDIAVILCNGQALARVANGALDMEVVTDWLKDRSDRVESVAGIGRFILLFGQRARFLTHDGVIDPDAVMPGQLTQSLCSPWQYDFADCGCFYWASNKPDLVSSPAQPAQVLNFQRRDRSESGDRAATADDWILKHAYRWDDDGLIYRHAEMIKHWADLPFVVRRQETTSYTPLAATPARKLLDRDAIVDRLRRLAPVEHALAVEYLYAYYSLGLPVNRPAQLDEQQARIYTAGSEIFQVAIDEMRHLRSVNEILIELGQPWQLERADIIGEDFDNDGIAFMKPFALRPLDHAQLDWFIDVEAVSQQDDENTIHGMYTLILQSVQASDEFAPEQKRRLAGLIKVIIDEGMDHYVRFSRAKAALAGIAESIYLKVRDVPQAAVLSDPDSVLQDVVDASYLVVLRSLDYVFQAGDSQRGALMESARRAMYNMDDAARSLAARSRGALFDYRRFGPVKPGPVAAVHAVAAGIAPPSLAPSRGHRIEAARAVGEPLRGVLNRLATAFEGEHADLAQRMARRLNEMTQDFEAKADGD